MGQSGSGPVDETAATFAPNQEKYVTIETLGFQSFVTITSTSTISDVRQQVLDDFDEDMLPPTRKFYFTVDGRRLSRKQESNKAYLLLSRKVKLCGLSVDTTTAIANDLIATPSVSVSDDSLEESVRQCLSKIKSDEAWKESGPAQSDYNGILDLESGALDRFWVYMIRSSAEKPFLTELNKTKKLAHDKLMDNIQRWVAIIGSFNKLDPSLNIIDATTQRETARTDNTIRSTSGRTCTPREDDDATVDFSPDDGSASGRPTEIVVDSTVSDSMASMRHASDADNEQFEQTIRHCLDTIRSDDAYMEGGPLRSDLDGIIRLEDPELLESFWQYVIRSLPHAEKTKEWVSKERRRLDENMARWREIVSGGNERSLPTTALVVPKDQKATPATTDVETNGEAPRRDLDTSQITKKRRRSLSSLSEGRNTEVLSSNGGADTGTIADAVETATSPKRKRAAGSKADSSKMSTKKKTKATRASTAGGRKPTGKSKSQITDEERRLFAQESREEFEKEKAAILSDLDDAYVARFGTIGFCSWSKKIRPVILLSPYDVKPNSQMRKDWMKMYNMVSGNTHHAVSAM